MARARNIKPGFFTNDELADLPALTRLLFIGLWTIADRSGRLEDRPKKIKAEVLPYDECDPDAMLSDLARLGFIKRYSTSGAPAIQVVKWDKHQNPHVKEAESTIQAPDEHQTSTVLADKPEQPKPELAGLIPDSGFRIPDPLTSVPKGTGDAGPDPIFGDGLSYLVRTGVPEKGARSFLGKMRKALNDDLVAVELLVKAQQLEVSDPVPWLRAAAQKRMGPSRLGGSNGVAL
jgi:hypothetical protein